MSSGRTDLKSAWPGWWVRIVGEPPDSLTDWRDVAWNHRLTPARPAAPVGSLVPAPGICPSSLPPRPHQAGLPAGLAHVAAAGLAGQAGDEFQAGQRLHRSDTGNTQEGVLMRQVVLQMGVTLDGYVAGPGGEGDWGLPDEHPDVRAWKLASLSQVGTHIMGRVTYEQMAAHWPNATGDYAASMNDLPKVVF